MVKLSQTKEGSIAKEVIDLLQKKNLSCKEALAVLQATQEQLEQKMLNCQV